MSSAKETKITASLVRARQVIADKFRKLNRKRLMYEKELEVKYAPITDSINKLIETKSQLNKEKKKADMGNAVEMEVDGNDLISLDETDHKKKSMPADSTVQLENEEKNKEYEVVRIYAPENKVTYAKSRNFNKNPPTSSEEVLTSTRNSFSSKRKSDRINEYDAHRFHENEQTEPVSSSSNILLYASPSSSQSKRKNVKTPPPLTAEKVLTSTRKSFLSKRKSDRTKVHDKYRFDERECSFDRKRQKTEIISPEDYDSDGHFVGLAAKRRKVERPVKHRVKRKTPAKKKTVQKPTESTEKILKSTQKSLSSNKEKNRENRYNAIPKRQKVNDKDKQNDAQKSELMPKRKTKQKITVSLEDYNEKGEFMGLAPKRRKIQISKEKLAEIQQNREKIKRRRAKYSGKGVEAKFIPYSENIVYEYYDNPNELVERLMLLVSSKSAGNTNHDQEINSILEELRERHIIH